MTDHAYWTGQRRLVTALLLAAALLAGLLPSLARPARAATPAVTADAAQPDSRGKDFWLAFPGNLGSQNLELFVTGQLDSTGRVEIPGTGWSTTLTVAAGEVTTVRLPNNVQLESTDGVERKAVHVIADQEVSVYGLNRVTATTDAFLALPTDILGTEYVTLGYQNADIVNGSQLAVAASEDDTVVTIVPAVTTGSRAAGAGYDVQLDAGETYQLRNTSGAPRDLSGSVITSDKPVAVYGSHQCANIPSTARYCDHVVEQLFPVDTWGRNFVTMPLATRSGGDTFRVVAGTDGTEVRLDGKPVVTLDRGEWHERLIDGPAHLTSTHPVMVAQYSNGSTFDGAVADPFMMLVPPHEQFLASYSVTTPSTGFSRNYVNVVVPADQVGKVLLDGAAVPSSAYRAIGTSGFSGAQVPVSLGSHRLSSTRAFGLSVYGFDSYDSYGYPGGLSLSEVALATSLTLTPATAPPAATGARACVTATVRDQDGKPLPGVRVDFEVFGANEAQGLQLADAAGQAQFCWTGSSPGQDTVVAYVGDLEAEARRSWTGSTDASRTFGFRKSSGYIGDPVNTATGNLVSDALDLAMPPGSSGLELVRTYNSLDTTGGVFGLGWSSALDSRVDTGSDGDVRYRAPDGRVVTFPAAGERFARVEELAADLQVVPDGHQLVHDDGRLTSFDRAGRIVGWSYWDGEVVQVLRDDDGRPTAIQARGATTIALRLDAAGRVVAMTTDDGRTVGFAYDERGLVAVTDPTGGTTRHALDAQGRLLRTTDPAGVVLAEAAYDEDGRVATQGSPGGTTYAFRYGEDGVTNVSDLNGGGSLVFRHDSLGRLTSIVDPSGEVVTRSYDEQGNLLKDVDRVGSTAEQTFDARGNVVTHREQDGALTRYIYDDRSRLVEVTSPTGAATRYAYEAGERLPSTVTDALGTVTTYDVVDGLIRSVTDPDGVRTSLTYDARGALASSTDGLGRTTTYTHDATGQETSVRSPSGATVRRELDALGRLLSETDAAGATTRFTYDAAGRLLTETDPTGATRRLDYDGLGRLATETAADGTTTTREHDALGRVVRETVGGATTETTYGPLSRVTSTTDAAGAVTTYEYDANGQRVATVDALGGRVAEVLDHRGRVVRSTDPLGRVAAFTYDAEDRPLTETDPEGKVTRHVYDAVGNEVETVDRTGGRTTREFTPGRRLRSSSDPAGRTTVYAHDSAGQLVSERAPDGALRRFGYDADGRRITEHSPSGLVTTTAYDAVGRIVANTTPGTGMTRTTWTARGEVAAVQDATGGVRRFTYDAVGNRITATAANGATTRWTYDERGNELTRTAADGAVERYDYDLADRQVRRTDALGRVTRTEYDALGRVVLVADPSGRETTRDYDAAGQLVGERAGDQTRTFAYDRAGQRTSATDARGTTTWTRDAEGRVLEQRSPGGRVLRYTYDPSGLRLSLARSDGATDTYRYDAAGRLVELASRGNTARYTYDADGNVVEEALPGGSRRMQWTEGQLSGYQQDGSPYQNGASITRDAAGRRLSETRAGVTTSYAYDAAGQLVSHGRARLTYDDTGRRTSVTEGPRRTDYRYDAAGQLLATSAGAAQTTYAYDAAGRRTQRQDARGTAVTEYDAWGQPARTLTRSANGTTTELRLTHDADGQLVAVTENGRTTSIEWDSERDVPQPTRIVRPDGRTIDLVHGATRAFAVVDGTKAVAQATDSLGSTLRNGGTGALAAAQSYDAFGDPGDSGQGGETVQLGYRGELTVGGLVHLRARDYDPTTGSLTTPDPLDTEPGQTSVASPYVYTLSDPLNHVDPLGLSAVDDRAFGRVRAAAAVGVAPAVPIVIGGAGVVSLPAIVATLGAAVALALLYRFGKKIFRVTIEYRGTYTPPNKRSVPKVGGVYFLTLTRNRAYVGQSNNIKRRFYEHLRKFSYDRPADIRSISVFHVAVSPGFDAPFRSVAECALHRNLTRQGVKVVNDTRYIPGC